MCVFDSAASANPYQFDASLPWNPVETALPAGASTGAGFFDDFSFGNTFKDLGAGLSLGGQIGGALTSATGAYYGAKAKQSALNLRANISDLNADLADLQARDAIVRGKKEETRVKTQYGNLAARQRVAVAANGITLDSPTAVSLIATTNYYKEQDAETIALNASREAWGYTNQAFNFRSQASMDRAGAGGVNPGLTAGTDVLGSASRISNTVYNFSRVGAF